MPSLRIHRPGPEQVATSEAHTRDHQARERRKRALWIFIIMGALVTILAFHRDGTDDELIGVWKLESTQTNGQPMRRERELWVFRHGRLTVVRDDEFQSVRVSIDPSVVPKQMDTDIILQPTGVYEIQGDTLRISQVIPDMPRPVDFETNWGDWRTVSVLSRLDANARMSRDDLRELLLSEYGPAPEPLERMEFDKEADDFITELMRKIDDKTEPMNEKEEVIYRVSWLTMEVNNGGFHQYFFNSTGEHAVETVSMLKRIGAPQTAALFETGCSLFPEGNPPKSLQARRRVLARFTLDQLETLRDLQERFYARREDLNVLLKRYWINHP